MIDIDTILSLEKQRRQRMQRRRLAHRLESSISGLLLLLAVAAMTGALGFALWQAVRGLP